MNTLNVATMTKLRELFARMSRLFCGRTRIVVPLNTREFGAACKELAFWSASDAGLDGAIETFDGSMLHRAADGMLTIRMTLRDSWDNRSPGEAAAKILQSFAGLRVLMLLEIDGSRFVNMAPNVNLGVRELGQRFTNRSGLAG
jgi:hypothetical protein